MACLLVYEQANNTTLEDKACVLEEYMKAAAGLQSMHERAATEVDQKHKYSIR